MPSQESIMNMDLDKNKGPRACTTCAKAKSRCIPGPEGVDKCERCHRLHKTCTSQTPAPPRAKKDPKPTKVAELERRLDDLTSQLHTSQGVSRPLALGRTQNHLDFVHIFPNEVEEARLNVSSRTGSSPDLDQRSSSTSSRDQLEPYASPASVWPVGSEADGLLKAFKERMEPLYPFVIVPPHLTSAELAVQRPYLWKAVMVAGCHLDAARQIVRGSELLDEIAKAAITKPQKSLDLLQGLQLLIAWYHCNWNSFQLTNLLFLARSMCIALGFKDSQVGPRLNEHTSHCLELMRAYTGCYYLNTLVFTTNKRPDAFMNTSFLQACCKILQEKAQYPSDELLIKLFAIQQLAQSISLTLGVDGTTFQSMQLPLTMVVQSFQQQLDVFKSSLPLHLRDNPTLMAHVSIAEILLYEIGIIESQAAASYVTLTDRLELLWGCLNATKTFLDIRFARMVHIQPRFICLSASDFLYAFIVSLKLMTLDVPGWDLQLVRRHISFSDVVDRQIEDMELFIERRKRVRFNGDGFPCAGIPNPNQVQDPYKRLTKILKHLKVKVETELERYPSQSAVGSGALVGEAVPAMIQDFDGKFWQDVLGDQAWNLNLDPLPSTTNWTY